MGVLPLPSSIPDTPSLPKSHKIRELRDSNQNFTLKSDATNGRNRYSFTADFAGKLPPGALREVKRLIVNRGVKISESETELQRNQKTRVFRVFSQEGQLGAAGIY